MEEINLPHIDPDIHKATTLPGSFYHDESIYELQKNSLFPSSWQWIASSDALRSPGQIFPFRFMPGLLDEPLMFAMGGADELRCLSNVCTHRGNLLVHKACKVPRIRCRYHGRLFGLDGCMEHMPEFAGVEGFPGNTDDLASIPWAQLGKHLFVNLGGAPSFDEWIGPVANRLGWLPINGFMLDSGKSKTYEINANWALYVDNYLEGFHIPFVHPGLNSVLDFGSYEEEMYQWGTLQVGVAKPGEAVFDLPETSPDYGKNIAAYYYWLFPNTMLNFYPWGLSINVVRPIGIDRTQVSFITYVWKPELVQFGAGADLDQVEKEDEEVVEAVQKGIRSRFYDRGRYSPTREKGVHHFHRLLVNSLKEVEKA